MKQLYIPVLSCAFLTSGSLLAQSAEAQVGNKINSNEFNPAISLILDGRYTDQDSDELKLPGFQLGGEAGPSENGFSTGHNELVFSANVDDKFYASMTAAIVTHDGATEIEMEEAFAETLGNYQGFTFKAGKFYSGIGYQNSQHAHSQNFSDRAWVYDALFGGNLSQTGLQANWQAPTDFLLQLGVELGDGKSYPGGENEDGNTASALFVKTGADIGSSHSWQFGLSYYASDFDLREAGGHHDHGGSDVDNELLDGEIDIAGLDFVYKWAPQGNSKNTSFTFATEYFVRNEQATSEFIEAGVGDAMADYDGEQTGYYLEAVYKFAPQWRVGARYDSLEADNDLNNVVLNTLTAAEYFEESALGSLDETFNRSSLMIDWSASHFSLVRLQFSSSDIDGETNDAITLQYLISLGSHGAHAF